MRLIRASLRRSKREMEVGLSWILVVTLCVTPLALSQNCNEFSEAPMDTVVAERGNVCLYCDYPNSDDVIWLRGSTSIESGVDSTVCNCRASAAPGQPISLCFDSVQREDADRYICRAQIVFGRVEDCSARLIVADAPNITNKPANPNIVIARRATENITVNYNPGNPPATVQWSKDGQLIDGLSNPLVSAVHNSTILTLTNNNASIRGRYLVNVSNIGGSDIFEYNVKAVFGPNINLRISSHNSNGIRLICSAQGYPRLDHVVWQTGDGYAVPGSVDEISAMESPMFDYNLASSLYRELRQCDSNIYLCLVSSGSITRSRSITCQIGVPRPLSTAPTTTNITSTSIDVSWQFPGGYVDFYTIQYKLSSIEWDTPDVNEISVMGFRTSVSINGLLPNTMYDLRIKTRNANRPSEWSPEATFTTLPPAVHIDGPSKITAGQTVVLVCNTSQNLMVTWSRDDGRPLPDTPDGNVLRIEMPAVEDGGVYRCSAHGVVATFNLVVVEEPATATTNLPPVNTALPGLSPGAIAGIAVGSIVVLGLIVGFFLFFFIYKVEAGTFQELKNPVAPPPDQTEISLHGNIYVTGPS